MGLNMAKFNLVALELFFSFVSCRAAAVFSFHFLLLVLVFTHSVFLENIAVSRACLICFIKTKKEVICQPNHFLAKMVQVLTSIIQVMGLETAECTSENLAHVRKLPFLLALFYFLI